MRRLFASGTRALLAWGARAGVKPACGSGWLDSVLLGMTEGMLALDAQGRVIRVNPAACAMLGYEEDDLLGLAGDALLHAPRTRRSLALRVGEYMGQICDGQAWLKCKNGGALPVSWRYQPAWQGHELLGGVVLMRNLSRDREEDAHRRLLISALENVANGVIITDARARIKWVNAAFERMTGYSMSEAVGLTPGRLLNSGAQSRAFYKNMWRTIRQGKVWHGELLNRRKDGTLYHEELTIAPVREENGRILHYVGVKQNVSKRKHNEREIHFQAHHDLLTGLANRRRLLQKLDESIPCCNEGRMLAVLFLDLDRFKPVNDRYGHHVGDQLLVAVADRLRSCVRGSDLVARLGGDEFVVLLDTIQAAEQAARVGRKILTALSQPLLLEGRDVTTSASLGIALCPHDGTDAATLLHRADQAMYRAKAAGRGRVSF